MYHLEVQTCQLIRRVVQVCIPASQAAYFESQIYRQAVANAASVQEDRRSLAVDLGEVPRTEVLLAV